MHNVKFTQVIIIPTISDTNIPETGEQKRKSSLGDEDCCYTHCGTPGRGLCEHCPGRPSSDDNPVVPVKCVSDNGTRTPGCKVGAVSSAPATRTHNKVFQMWTAWIFMSTIKIQTVYNILQYLLVLCGTCVRTALKRMKTKWRSRS